MSLWISQDPAGVIFFGTYTNPQSTPFLNRFADSIKVPSPTKSVAYQAAANCLRFAKKRVEIAFYTSSSDTAQRQMIPFLSTSERRPVRTVTMFVSCCQTLHTPKRGRL